MKLECITYQSKDFSEDKIASRYIGASPVLGMVKLFDVNAAALTIRESFVQAIEFPVEAVSKCEAQRGQAFGKVMVG